MASFNSVVLVGNITRSVELKYLPSGTAVCDIGLAVNDRVKRGEEWIDEATFVDCVLFGRTAEVAAEFLDKGSPCLISGRLKLDQWEDKDTGQKRSKLKVIGEKMQMLGGKRDGSAPRSDYDQRRPGSDDVGQAPVNMADDPDVPF